MKSTCNADFREDISLYPISAFNVNQAHVNLQRLLLGFTVTMTKIFRFGKINTFDSNRQQTNNKLYDQKIIQNQLNIHPVTRTKILRFRKKNFFDSPSKNNRKKWRKQQQNFFSVIPADSNPEINLDKQKHLYNTWKYIFTQTKMNTTGLDRTVITQNQYK